MLPTELAALRELIERDPIAGRRTIEAELLKPSSAGRQHAAWAELCELAGSGDLASREWRLALDASPADASAARHLAVLLVERGHAARASRVLEQALRAGAPASSLEPMLIELRAGVAEDFGTDAAREEPAAPRARPEADWSDAERVRFLSLFGGREDVHARQWATADGRSGWSPVHEPLTPRRLQGHLCGDMTLGIYPVRLDGSVTCMALDVDIRSELLEKGAPGAEDDLQGAAHETAVRAATTLSELGLSAVLEDSGYKGRHAWIFLRSPLPAPTAHALGRAILAVLGPATPAELRLEWFPKQGRVDRGGLGNLIKLPLGIHRRSGRRSTFVTEDGTTVVDSAAHVRTAALTAPRQVMDALARLRHESSLARPHPPRESAAPSPDPAATQDVSGATQPAPAGPRLPDPPAPWTDADFDSDAPVRALLTGCGVVRHLKGMVERHGRLSHAERTVLVHSLGHVPRGASAVNHLLQRCAGATREQWLRRRLSGHPISCPRVRQQVPHVAAGVDCNCSFPDHPDEYPSPLLHARAVAGEPSAEPVAPTLTELARTRSALERRICELQREADAVTRQVVAGVADLPGALIHMDDGTLSVVESPEGPRLEWTPRERAPAPFAQEDDARAQDDGS